MEHSRARTVLLGTSCLFTAVLASTAARADGLPTGGTVVGGSATITSPTSTSTVINQTSNKAILTWEDFSIASGSSVTFNQPGATSIALNRVLGSTPSTINGDLFANGHVWLINGNGILFGKGSQISVGSLIATTADINDQDFMDGNYKFGSASANPNAGIVNNGSIYAANGGSVVLAGPVVSNNGIIQADLGSVTLGGVSTFSVDFQGDNLLRFAVGNPVQQTPVDANGNPVKALVSNAGTVQARGGRILMTTRAAESVVNNVINNTGMIEATSVAVKDGEVVLDAGDGTVELGGTVDASGRNPGETGGNVTVEAKKIVVADNTRIDVSGDAGGGRVHIGGDRHGDGPMANAQTTTVGRATITADALSSGNGGDVVIWADQQTDFAGSISARGGAEGGDGGFVETSGAHLSVAAEATVDTLAPKGKTGTWLLDPTNIFIQTGGETTLNDGDLTLADDPGSTDFIDPSTIVSALSSTNVMLEASNDIVVVDDLIYSSTHALSLLAEHDIDVHANIQNTLASGGGAINLIAGWDGTTTDPDHFTDAGVYGNNFGGVQVGGSSDPAVGGASGLLTVAGDQVTVDASNGETAQIGFHGAGGGDIRVLAQTLSLVGGDGSVAQIGNGSFGDDISGDVTGNIDIRVADQTFFSGGSNGGRPWIGNANGSGGASTGDLIVITGNFNEEGSASDLGDMAFADLNGGNVTIGETGDTLSIGQDFIYNSPHDLTLLSTGNVAIAGVMQNAGSGALTAIAGWDGTTVDRAHLTDAGVFGNNGGTFALVGGEGGNDAAFGSRSGTTTVAGFDVDFFNFNGLAQLGYHGDGSGNINLFAVRDLNVHGGNAATDFALIGNGSLGGDVTSDVSGNITIRVGGLTTLAFGGEQSDGGLAWIGNVTGGPGKATGNVSLVTGQVTSYGTNAEGNDPNTLATIMTADLGTSADTGGNFTLGLTNPDTDFLDAMIGGGLAYSSPHDLAIFSTGNLTIANSIQNSGDGALTILAGWNPDHVATADVLAAPDGYGQNGAFVWVVGATGSLADYNPNAEGDHFVDSGLGTAVGSRGGVTTIGGAQIYVEGLSGYAQIGYHGDGGSGAINVIANGVPGDGGLDGVDACFDGNANICVIGGRDGWGGDGALVYAQIGNLGMGVEGSSTADINVRATGNIAVAGGGINSNGDDPAIPNAYGMIGSGDATGGTTQDVSGNIDVRAAGQINFVNSTASNSFTWLGNRTSGEGTHSGNVVLIGDKVDGDDMGEMIAYDLGTDPESGGDFLLGITGHDGLDIQDANNFSSPHRLSLLSAGDITVEGTLENSGKGDIDLVAGWDGTTLTPANFTDEGVYGNNGGGIFIGGEGALPLAGVGSKKGTVTAAGDAITLSAISGDAQLGFAGTGGGDVNVLALSDVNVLANSANLRALIGNGFSGASSATGNISITAGGDVFLSALGDSSFAVIGNVSNAGSESGDIAIAADGLESLASGADSRAVVGNISIGGSEGDETGDISLAVSSLSLTANNAGARAEIGGGRDNASAAGDIDVTSGDIDLESSGDGSFARIGSGGLGNVTGDITVASTDGITLGATNGGNAIIGFGAGGTIDGDVSVSADGGILLTSGDPSQARIGDATEGDVTGDLNVTAVGDIRLLANDQGATATIGTQGANVTSNIDVESTGGGLDLFATGEQSLAQIGNSATGDAAGDITVTASEAGIWLLADASGASALIGDFASGDVNGSVNVHTGGIADLSASGGGDAGIGSQSDSAISSDISVAGQVVSLSGSPDSQTFIGNHASGDIGGAISVRGDNAVVMADNARIGSHGDGMISGDISVVAGGEGFVMAASDAGAQTVVGHSAAGDVNGSIDITLNDSALQMLAANGSSAVIGSHSGGSIDGHIDVTGALGFNMISSGPGSLARIGSDASVDVNSEISVDASGGLVAIAANDGGTAAVGHSSSGTIHSDIDLQGATMLITASGAGSHVQIGHGANGAVEGNIDVTSNGGGFALNADNGGFAWIGSGSNGPVTGSITLAGIGSDLSLAATSESTVRVGHGATGDIAGDITVTTDGLLSLSAVDPGSAVLIGGGGGSTINGDIDVNGASGVSLNSAGGSSVAQVGNDAAGDLTGDVTVISDGSIELAAADGSTSQIGGGTGGSITGDIAVTAGDAIDLAVAHGNGRSWIGQGAAGDVTGDIGVTAANDVTLAAGGDGAIAQIGSNVVVEGTLTGNTSVELQHGQVSLDASGANALAQIGGIGVDTVNGDVTALANDSENGSIGVSAGGDGAVALIGNGGFPGQTPPTTSGAVTVHTAGTLTIQAAGNNAYAQVGHHASGGGDIEVRAADLQILGGDGGGIAQLGNGSLNDDLTGDVSGNADIRIANSTIFNAHGGHAWVGNANGSGGDHTGNLLFITGTQDDQSDNDEFANALKSDIVGGDVTLGLTDASQTVGPGSPVVFNSEHTFNLLVAGDIDFRGSLQNQGSGALNIVAGWDGTTLDPAHFADSGVYGNGAHGITLGGDTANGNVAVGSQGGTTTVLGDSLTLSAVHGYAQLGYHGAGSGDIVVNVLNDVDLNGGGSTGFFAQIGNGGYQTNGSNSGDISVDAGGDVTLTGGAGGDAYAQVGQGGAESNTNAVNYANSGTISVSGENVTLDAGSGNAAYAQIGQGGYKVGAGVTGTSDNSGDITVTAAHAVALTGNGNDAYAQIGNGGDQLNTNAGSAIGTISGNIVVQAEDPDDGSVTMNAGGGTASYVMIGNGGYSINTPTSAPPGNFTITGNITVSDLALTGGDGNFGYAQIGNGDGSKTGTGDVSGDILIESGDITLTDGTGQDSPAIIHNAIGHGTVSGNVEGFDDGGEVNNNPATTGTIVELSNPEPPPLPPETDTTPEVLLTQEPNLVEPPTTDQTNPIEDMSGGDGDETPSDKAAGELGDSLNGGNKTSGQVILGGILKSQGQGGPSSKPHSVPAADEDYSSWGNEALWQ